ncbi:MAG TPA: T9SS type A sorting domain-containing protein [Ignavibacteriaceae bacterium]|nr:T9SS type A sorting domain-containing protein [Ignavibacteriaceae bacterium]
MKKVKLLIALILLIGTTVKADTPMPVELVYFEGSAVENGIMLIWGTATELNNFGFEIHRSINNAPYENIGFVFGHGTSYAPHDYDFPDTGLIFSGSFRYFLKQLDTDGAYKHTDTISVDFSSSAITEINYFQVEAIENGAELNWGTLWEVNNYGFSIYRGFSESEFDSIGFVGGNGTTIEPGNFSFVDTSVTTAGEYSYFIKQLSLNGASINSDTLAVSIITSINDLATQELNFVLHQNYPNPFNPSTNIRFSLNNSGHVTLKLYDVIGKEVGTIINEYLGQGNHDLSIDAGKYTLTSGIYFLSLESGATRITRKIVLQK